MVQDCVGGGEGRVVEPQQLRVEVTLRTCIHKHICLALSLADSTNDYAKTTWWCIPPGSRPYTGSSNSSFSPPSSFVGAEPSCVLQRHQLATGTRTLTHDARSSLQMNLD